MFFVFFSTSLEPDEEVGDQSVFDGLVLFVGSVLGDEERMLFFRSQLPLLVDSALQLKMLKPPRGLHFSLQQQSNSSLFFFTLIIFPLAAVTQAPRC